MAAGGCVPLGRERGVARSFSADGLVARKGSRLTPEVLRGTCVAPSGADFCSLGSAAGSSLPLDVAPSSLVGVPGCRVAGVLLSEGKSPEGSVRGERGAALGFGGCEAKSGLLEGERRKMSAAPGDIGSCHFENERTGQGGQIDPPPSDFCREDFGASLRGAPLEFGLLSLKLKEGWWFLLD